MKISRFIASFVLGTLVGCASGFPEFEIHSSVRGNPPLTGINAEQKRQAEKDRKDGREYNRENGYPIEKSNRRSPNIKGWANTAFWLKFVILRF